MAAPLALTTSRGQPPSAGCAAAGCEAAAFGAGAACGVPRCAFRIGTTGDTNMPPAVASATAARKRREQRPRIELLRVICDVVRLVCPGGLDVGGTVSTAPLIERLRVRPLHF